jgi:hypothetical protein
MLLLVGGVLYLPLPVHGKLPVLVGARLLLLPRQQQADIGLLRVGMMLRLVVVVVGGRMMLFFLLDNGLLFVGLLEMSLVVLLVLCQLPVVVRGQLVTTTIVSY